MTFGFYSSGQFSNYIDQNGRYYENYQHLARRMSLVIKIKAADQYAEIHNDKEKNMSFRQRMSTSPNVGKILIQVNCNVFVPLQRSSPVKPVFYLFDRLRAGRQPLSHSVSHLRG